MRNRERQATIRYRDDLPCHHALVAIFVFYPILKLIILGFVDDKNGYSLPIFWEKFTDDRIWSLACVYAGKRWRRCLNSVFMAVIVGFLTTALGLVFALIRDAHQPALPPLHRAISVIPIITPPFVIGLAIILLFGFRASSRPPSAICSAQRRHAGSTALPGIVIAQTLAYTPIAFLVLIGVVESVSPSMEEAAQTLRASPMQVLNTVSLKR